MRARYARRIREGLEWGRSQALLSMALQQPPAALLDGDPRGAERDPLLARAYRAGVAQAIIAQQPRRHRRTWRPRLAA